jgi:hypothetical protein
LGDPTLTHHKPIPNSFANPFPNPRELIKIKTLKKKISSFQKVKLLQQNLNHIIMHCSQGRSEDYPFRGCKTTFCRQKGVASARLGRGQGEPYSFLSDVQRLTPNSKIIYFILFLK